MADRPPAIQLQAASESDMTANNPGKPMGAAASDVFNTPELLENILLQLTDDCRDKNGFVTQPALDLFVVRRVCKTFDATIAASVILLQCMFLAPIEADICAAEAGNRVLESHAPFEWLTVVSHMPAILDNEDQEEAIRAAIEGEYSEYSTMPYSMRVAHLVVNFDTTTLWYHGGNFEAFAAKKARPEASWRQMKACNSRTPSHIEVNLRLALSLRDQDIYGKQDWYVGQKATLGEIFDRFLPLHKILALHEQRDDCEALLEQSKIEEDPPEDIAAQRGELKKLDAKWDEDFHTWQQKESKLQKKEDEAMKADGYARPVYRESRKGEESQQ